MIALKIAASRHLFIVVCCSRCIRYHNEPKLWRFLFNLIRFAELWRNGKSIKKRIRRKKSAIINIIFSILCVRARLIQTKMKTKLKINNKNAEFLREDWSQVSDEVFVFFFLLIKLSAIFLYVVRSHKNRKRTGQTQKRTKCLRWKENEDKN